MEEFFNFLEGGGGVHLGWLNVGGDGWEGAEHILMCMVYL